ncbi:hypothetical protein P280DRAFT_321835 [Massarina eburnea CBS 473.64]|uniref:Uncharacterized protein n=1 Tax=Massarina eburnea CBS 473.64 TaxID=1395130 RepID=A0A6A6RYC1_9PLEO|nr:hypothetical protein P280DRAFT_321835 [Massarina eburnea CBS 473.64]
MHIVATIFYAQRCSQSTSSTGKKKICSRRLHQQRDLAIKESRTGKEEEEDRTQPHWKRSADVQTLFGSTRFRGRPSSLRI